MSRQDVLPDIAAVIAYVKSKRRETREKNTAFEKARRTVFFYFRIILIKTKSFLKKAKKYNKRIC